VIPFEFSFKKLGDKYFSFELNKRKLGDNVFLFFN